MAERQRGFSNFPEVTQLAGARAGGSEAAGMALPWPGIQAGSEAPSSGPGEEGWVATVPQPPSHGGPPFSQLCRAGLSWLLAAGLWVGGDSSLLRGGHAGTWLLTGNAGGTGFFWAHDAGPSAWGTEAGCTHRAGCRHAQEGGGQPSREWGLHPFPGFQLLALLSLHGLLMPLLSPHCSPQGKSGLLTAERGVSASVSHSLAALCSERVGPLRRVTTAQTQFLLHLPSGRERGDIRSPRETLVLLRKMSVHVTEVVT